MNKSKKWKKLRSVSLERGATTLRILRALAGVSVKGELAEELFVIWETTEAEEWIDKLDWIPFKRKV